MVGYDYVLIESGMKRSERAVHSLCNLFAKDLYDREWDMRQEINSWRDELVRQINDHEREQIERLKQEYQKQSNRVKDTRQQFLNATRSLEGYSGNNERIDQLLEQCKALKFELAALEFPERSILFIQFMTEEQLQQRKQLERKIERQENNQSRNNFNLNSRDVHNTSLSTPISGLMQHTNQVLNTTRSSNKNPPPSSSNDNRCSNTDTGNRSIEECPVCSMTFPTHMARSEQATHVNAHFEES